jgi:hypothetical protein
MTTGPEITLVELPFIDQLVRMGWKRGRGRPVHFIDGEPPCTDLRIVRARKRLVRARFMHDSGHAGEASRTCPTHSEPAR